ncbi:MAG TPA: hypothetical protein VGP26_23970 [Actinophytocola sp.]|jgi:hypothetical protein|nr:hypothetical protein [Actinophytocola sp.]
MRRPGIPRDTLVFAAKIATAVVLTGVVAGFLLMAAGAGGGGGDDVAVTDPAVPTITDGGGPPSTGDAQPAPAPPPVTVPAPAVGTQTAVLAPKPKPTRRPTVTRPGLPDRFERPGGRCRPAGAVAFTRRLEPLVCRDGRWQRMF